MKKITMFCVSLLAIFICTILCGCFTLQSEMEKSATSAYNNAVENGFEGTMTEWFATLGQTGQNGKDSYEIAVENGYQGTREQWVQSLLESNNYLSVAKYAQPNTGADVSAQIQKAIDENPNCTIYFPDGEYLLASPITTPAHPQKSVSLKLSNYTVLKASGKWSNSEAMIRLGATNSANDITTNGSNYFLEGGIIDGNGVANGISIDGGRETRVADTSVKNTIVGLHIKTGANSGSSDADILNVNIVGTNTENSIGVLVEGYDNTFTNMRIANVKVGVKLTGGGNFLRNVHCLYIETSNFAMYPNSIGFNEVEGGNFFDNCYSDQFATGFKINGYSSIFDNCFCFWYSNKNNMHTGFHCTGDFNSIITNARVSFHWQTSASGNTFFKTDTNSGTGQIVNPMFNPSLNGNSTYQNYLQGQVVEI